MKSFFFSGGKPQPVYFWISLLMILVVGMIIMAMMNRLPISDTVFISILGLVGGWVALYNWDRTNRGGKE
jgi:NhaP-type Na+/H+ or K+/H+ antiporter